MVLEQNSFYAAAHPTFQQHNKVFNRTIECQYCQLYQLNHKGIICTTILQELKKYYASSTLYMHNEIISVEMPAKASAHEQGTTTGVKA